LEKIQAGEVISLADSNYILLEFSPEISYSALFRALREVAMTSYFPVLAHVERYQCMREEGRIEEVRALGVMLQMNYAHIGGKWYDADTKWCRKMLRENLIDLLGTDMHNCQDRGPRMDAAMEWMKKHLDEEYLEQITTLNAQVILELKDKKEE
jgi:protein-tyrosine phosphatase